ncbi:PREDICTED: cyclin-I2 [Chinchilla lanigera]|uniref:cyclin-I2 n=1 Tax=Chinchilla lanigera TaxID=34839 RepID=UPI000697A3EC|nr:PREDICTED: cyclin-I2 [Chinchilla lanigera]
MREAPVESAALRGPRVGSPGCEGAGTSPWPPLPFPATRDPRRLPGARAVAPGAERRPGVVTPALSIFARLLASVKVRECTLQCAIIVCLRLAAKLNEEDELIPCVTDFIKHCGSCYSPNELRRMEISILKDLHWDLHIATPLDFLNIVSMRHLRSLPDTRVCLWNSCSRHRTAKHRCAQVLAHAPQRGNPQGSLLMEE